MAKQEEALEQKPDAKAAPAKHSTLVDHHTTRNVLLIVVGVLVLAAAFLGGMQAADNRRGPFDTAHGFGMPFSAGVRERGRYGGHFQNQNSITLSAKVTAVNGNDFTVDQNGSSKTIKTDSNTRFRGVGISGIKSGDQVIVSGTTNSDGSIQATSVTVGAISTSSETVPAPDAANTQSF